jgi:hypothetical protein
MVVELKDARALADPRIAAFLERGFESVGDAGYGQSSAMVRELADEVRQGFRAVLFDVEAKLMGFVVLDGYVGPWRDGGWIVHFYAESRAARRRLVDEAARWFRARDVYRVRAINRSGGSDKAFIRAFAGCAGFEGRVVGSVVEIVF